MWVFGYGSLVWNPGFQFNDSKVGCIRGYARRFWQGNEVHRGAPGKPGRVATLVEEKEEVTWGRAFQLSEDDGASSLSYLENREIKLGGYTTVITCFYPRDPHESPFPVLLYIAVSTNPSYLGPASISQLAKEITESRGICGHNVEYVIRLAEFMRDSAPNVWDDHLFTIEHLIKSRLKESNIPLESLMSLSMEENPRPTSPRRRAERARRSPELRTDFASQVESPKLRCLNI